MAGIFISYRREDSAGWTRSLAADLAGAFPEHRVFLDIASIEVGEDFVDAIRRELSSCKVVLVVIGPHWLRVNDEAGKRRLDDPEDWVQLEVAESLQRPALRVVPLLVGGVSMPRAADLPELLRTLARRTAVEISDTRWDYDVARLVAALEKIVSPTASASAPGIVVPLPAAMKPPVAAAASNPPASLALAESKVPPATPAGTPGAPGSVFREGADGPEMVVVPAGEFMMGSPESEEGRYANEGPQHKVKIALPFAVGRFAVTFDEWDACVVAGGSAHEPDDNGWGRGRRPVINVSWEDAQVYVTWLANKTGKPYRLLSEAEWEYAARAGATTRYPWGDEAGTGRANFFGSGSRWSGEQTAPVGSFKPNAFGLFDMIGNVWEWVQDCWNYSYDGAHADGSAWESGDCGRRVARGGCWFNLSQIARAADRYGNKPGYRYYTIGFRVARTL